ncbi:MAG: Eco57I restriction-modification methylase domain-containing protein [Candidatus Levybacteria bacterium]|nr:Eco57I restriction-modification methylase domain-containing protein [Candidatus Levybacteria bacterium]
MDKNTATRLIQDVFQNPFNRDRFVTFTKNLFNFLDTEKNFVYRGNFIPDAYKPYINTLERIGKYEDVEENKIDVLIVHLKKEHSIEHARTMQRNFIAWYLGGSRGGELKDAALVAFHTDNPDDWRFSLVKMDYQIQDDKNNPLLSDLEKAFNIEVVTQEFFEKYKSLFLDVKDSLDRLMKKDQAIAKDFADKGVDPVDFSKKLLGQIVFLYFLQKKGWFGVERDSDWGTGPKNFLRLLFEKMIANYKNFFNDILEPLFYEALAKERDDDFYSRFNCKIPFLNGGLFDPLSDYDWVHTDILLPDELFSNLVRTKEGDTGTGILDIFDRYNFTVKEDEPLEKEVAVDPEMLGKVFENLLEVKDRKSKGTYYTPREIVHYMCQESLINYLVNECEGKVGRKDIETLIQYGETAVEHDSRVEQEGKETETYSYKLPESIRKNAQLLDDKLKNIRVCDPAIGSGAFPVGMMNEIIRTRNTLTNYLEDKKDRSIYNFKRDAIQNSLYGVDIDPGAVEIAKLRLWLSLVVDEEDIKQIKPLPNLDYKIVCGNSLLSINRQNLFVDYNLKQIEKLKEELFNETNTRKKQEYKEQIDKLITEVTDNNETFDLEIYFSEIFEDDQKGFDIVIANPPYVGEKGNEEIFHEVAKTDRGKKFYTRWMDYFYFFFHKALDISHENSVISFISTNYFFTATGAIKLREDLKNRATFLRIINFDELKIFEAARGQHNAISILMKGNYPSILSENSFVNRTGFGNNDVLHKILSGKDDETTYYKVEQNRIYEGYDFQIRLGGYGNQLNNPIENIFEKMKRQPYRLGQVCQIIMGLVSRADKVSNRHFVVDKDLKAKKGDGIFILSDDELENLHLDKSDYSKYVKPYFKNSDIGKYYCNLKNDQWVLYMKDEGEPINLSPELKSHFGKYEVLLTKLKSNFLKNKIAAGFVKRWLKNGNYFVLFNPKNEEYFTDAKIVAPYRSKLNKFAYNESSWFASQDVCFIYKKSGEFNLKFILSILNSKLCFLWLFNKGKRKGNILELMQKPLSEIPIKKISESEQRPFVEIVDKILAITSSSDYLSNAEKQAKVKDYEKQIDQLVYQLYGLTPEEIKIVEETI